MEFINLKQGNMIVKKYPLKFSTLSRYAPSLVSNQRDKMSRFVKGVADLVVEECCTAMLHDDMTLARLIVYAQSIEYSKHRKMATRLKRSGASDKEKTRSQMVHSQGRSSSAKFKVEKEGGSKDGNPTCANLCKKNYGVCLLGTGRYIGCGKDGHKVRDCTMIASRGREGKQVAPSVKKYYALTKRRFYALCFKVEKPDEKESDDDVCKFSFFYYDMSSF